MMENKKHKEFSGQSFNKPLYVDGVLKDNPLITIARQPFLLERYDFDKIIKGESFLLTIANGLLGATIALFVNMIAKLIGNKLNSEIQFDDWEAYAFAIALIIMICFYILNKFIPNEKRKIVTKIKNHFENY